MGRFLVFLGVLIGVGCVSEYVSGFEADWTKYYSEMKSLPQKFDAAWATNERQIESGAWMVLGLCLSGGLILAGRRLIAGEKAPREDSIPVSAVAVPDRAQDRSGNPFKRGAVSETVLPRGEFHKNRNKFRKTIERPNSDGY